MALHPDNTLITNREMLVEVVMTPLRAIGRFMIAVAESNARTQALYAINAMSDAELEAKGLTRAEAVSQAFRYDA